MVSAMTLLMKTAKLWLVFVALTALVPGGAMAQSSDDIPLGDLARSVRGDHLAPTAPIIDNDNLSQAMDNAQKLKMDDVPVFSIAPGGQKFQMASPDGTCSLSFNANATALISDPQVARELPQDELAKLDGPASIDSDTLEVSLYNGTSWNLTEVVVGLTLVRHENPEAPETAYYGKAKLITAAAEAPVERNEATAGEPAVRRSDSTVLYHMKGSAAPLKTTTFREIMSASLPPGAEWHWAIVSAKGVPLKLATPVPLTSSANPIRPLLALPDLKPPTAAIVP